MPLGGTLLLVVGTCTQTAVCTHMHKPVQHVPVRGHIIHCPRQLQLPCQPARPVGAWRPGPLRQWPVAGDGWSGSQLAHVLNFHSPGTMPKENLERQPTGAELDLAGWCTRVLTFCDTEETPRTGRMVVHGVDAGSQRGRGPGTMQI